MGKPYSDDLRSRVVAAVEAGASRHAAAARFGVGVSSVVRWVQLWRRSGSVSPRPMGGDRSSRLVGEKRDWLLARLAVAPDLTLEEMRRELGERGVVVGYGTVWRFFEREKISFKKKPVRQRAGST